MKEKILSLKNKGMSNIQIARTLGCAKSTVSFHCNINTRINSRDRARIYKKRNPIRQKIEYFRRDVSEKARCFQRRNGSVLGPRKEYNFTTDDVLKKIGTNPRCYLSGRPIDLSDGKSFSFDHILPSTRGGDNSLDNLGLVQCDLNRMKKNLTKEEFIQICKEILIFNGYCVYKNTN